MKQGVGLPPLETLPSVASSIADSYDSGSSLDPSLVKHTQWSLIISDFRAYVSCISAMETSNVGEEAGVCSYWFSLCAMNWWIVDMICSNRLNWAEALSHRSFDHNNENVWGTVYPSIFQIALRSSTCSDMFLACFSSCKGRFWIAWHDINTLEVWVLFVQISNIGSPSIVN